jgi:chromosome segregation ATPase
VNDEEEKQEDKTCGDGHATLPTSSSIKYTPPSISNESGQASSVQESLYESDNIPEATAGGPELVSVSSTSRLSASLGMQEEEFANMHESDPAWTLKLLLSKKQNQSKTSSERTTSDSAPSNAEINSTVRQDSLLLRLTTEFAQQDVLKQLEGEHTRAYNHMAFLKKLHNPLTDEATLGKVIQLSSIIDQFAKAVQRKNENEKRLDTQKQAQAMFYEKVQEAQAEVDRLCARKVEGINGINECNHNISHYNEQIKALEEQIVEYRRKIIQEEITRVQLEHEVNTSTQELIDEKGREGLQAFGSAEILGDQEKNSQQWHILR